jgi:ribonuclease HIII
MKLKALELDRLVRDWSLRVSQQQSLLQRISECALTAVEVTSLVPFGRALCVLDSQKHPPKIQERIAGLRVRLDVLRDREFQVDELGNLNNEPQALFDILGEDVAGIQGFDLGRIRQAQISGSNGAESARALLEALGWERLASETANMLKTAVEDLLEREDYAAWGLFIDNSVDQGWALGIHVLAREAGQRKLWSEGDKEASQQADIALQDLQGWEAKIEWPASYVGESIGLPLYIASLVVRNLVRRHSLTASTGRLEIDGHVKAVTGIRQKVEAAKRIGMRRVLVPRENFDEAKAAAGTNLNIVPVGQVTEVIAALRQSSSAVELGQSGLIRLVRASVPDFSLVVKKEIPGTSGYRFVVANAQGTASIWVHPNGHVRSDGPTGTARESADHLINNRMPSEPEERETLTFQLPTGQMQDAYHSKLEQLGAMDELPHDHEKWRMKLSRGRSRATVVLYSSDSCVVQGTAPASDDARAAVEDITKGIGGLVSPKATKSLPSSRPSSDNSEPHIGTDEAGKGDYFGPLVSAAVFVDRIGAAILRQLGVRDSKTLSDRRIRELADKIRGIPEVRHAVTAINPRKFNELYEQFRREGKNLNSLLAWGHARSIDSLLNALANKRVNAQYVLVDQFADKHYIEQRTRRAGIPVHQRPKAEEDIAVAAASVLARDGFLRWLERWSERTQIVLPKGASPQVIQAAKQFVRRWGAKWLGEVAKLNFRTTVQVLDGEDKNVDKRPPEWIGDATDFPSEG